MKRTPSPVREAIRLYSCLFGKSYGEISRDFGVSIGTAYNIINNKYVMKSKRMPHWTSSGQEKRKQILGMLKARPMDISEIHAAIGSDPEHYLTEMKKMGKIDCKCVWVLK